MSALSLAQKEDLKNAIEEHHEAQVQWLATLCRYDSTRGNEATCQNWLAGEFRNRGWTVDQFTIAETEIAGLPGYSPEVDADYTRASQVVATVAPQGIRAAASSCRDISTLFLRALSTNGITHPSNPGLQMAA